MAKPILLVKVEQGLLTQDQFGNMKSVLIKELECDYHVFVLMGINGFKGLTFEVHGISIDSPKETIINSEDLISAINRGRS